MLQRTLPVPLLVQLGVVRKAELNRTADYGDGVYYAVRLRYETAVDAARRRAGRGAMVLGSLSDCLDLRGGEPLPQARVGTDYPAALKMMRLAVHRQPKVVTGSGGQQHLPVYVISLAHSKSPVCHRKGVVLPVRLVKGGIAGDYLAVYVIPEAFAYHVAVHK